MFAGLEDPKPRWQSFAVSYLVQISATVLLATISIAAPQLIQNHYHHVELIAPTLDDPAPYKPPKVKIAPSVEAPQKAVLEKLIPKIVVPAEMRKPTQVAEVAAPKLPPAPAPKFDSVLMDKPAGPKIRLAVQTNVFSGSSAQPTLPNTPAHQVQTGGFGDPNGVQANPNAPAGKVSIAQVGGFDMPNGPGKGNGTGGGRGLQGTIASAGFGNGVATEGGMGGHGGAAMGRVQTTAFAASAPAPEPPKARQVAQTGAFVPVSIVSKPNPTYTEEAKKLHVEGEVLVQVVFAASGEVRVVRVLRGLGHGLDESAVQAAQKVHFIPAQRNGQPVDSSATLHIVFQLS